MGFSGVFSLKNAARKNGLPSMSWSVPSCLRGINKSPLLSLRPEGVVGSSGLGALQLGKGQVPEADERKAFARSQNLHYCANEGKQLSRARLDLLCDLCRALEAGPLISESSSAFLSPVLLLLLLV